MTKLLHAEQPACVTDPKLQFTDARYLPERSKAAHSSKYGEL